MVMVHGAAWFAHSSLLRRHCYCVAAALPRRTPRRLRTSPARMRRMFMHAPAETAPYR